MNLLSRTTDYLVTIKQAASLQGRYDRPVIFHCYWNGELSEKHLISIRSCYYFNVHNKHANSIILWLENSAHNNWTDLISNYAEIRTFDLLSEQYGTPWVGLGEKFGPVSKERIPFYSDYIRCLLLYKYQGMWFDLDILFLRSFDPIFCNFSDEVFLYTWENQKYPNNAIFGNISSNNKLEEAMHYIVKRGRGWGFQEANLTFDLPLDFLVLPCSWFDAAWVPNPFIIDPFIATDKVYNFDDFYTGAFAYHWHNQWNRPIEEKSVIDQLNKRMINHLNKTFC